MIEAGPADLTPGRRAAICARIIAAVETCFPHDVAGSVFETSAAMEAWVDGLLAAPGRAGFALACQSGLASLRNGHTEYHDWKVMTAPPLSFHARPLGPEGWTVTASRRSDLNAGQRILAIDGAPPEVVFDRIAPAISASRPASAAASAFFRSWLLPREAAVTLDDGTERPLRCPAGAALPAPHPAAGFRRLSGDIGLLSAPDFSEDTARAALALLDDACNLRALVVDLRGNAGGATPMALLRALHPGRIPLWQEVANAVMGLDRALRDPGEAPWPPTGRIVWPVDYADGNPDAFGGELIILQDALTCSAAEDFIMPFKTSGRARILGEASAGTTGQPCIVRIDGDAWFRVAAKCVLWPDGTPFEGAGIIPDIEIIPRPEDLLTGYDPVLAHAMELLGIRVDAVVKSA